jgi:predicted acyl esterase
VIVEGGYIRVVQDAWRYGSEGDYVMNRSCATAEFDESDHATDTYDTIDWLVKNTPSNGKVGILGFLTTVFCR